MKNVFIGIVAVRDRVWHISYDHTCDCGCVKKRFVFIYNGKEPSETKIKQLINEDYGKK